MRLTGNRNEITGITRYNIIANLALNNDKTISMIFKNKVMNIFLMKDRLIIMFIICEYLAVFLAPKYWIKYSKILAIKNTIPKFATAKVEVSAIIHFVMTGKSDKSAKKKKSKIAIVFDGLKM